MEIVLIRHGKPTAAVNPKVSAAGFSRWVKNYNDSQVALDSLPPEVLTKVVAKHWIVSSDLARAIHSARLCMNRPADLSLSLLREMDIPRYQLPFKLKAYTWLVLNRCLWLLGVKASAEPSVESFKQAKGRALSSAEELQVLAIKHNKVAVFGHGLMNKFIAKELIKLGWLAEVKGKKYWSSITLTKYPH